jgi:hypothetical protein
LVGFLLLDYGDTEAVSEHERSLLNCLPARFRRLNAPAHGSNSGCPGIQPSKTRPSDHDEGGFMTPIDLLEEIRKQIGELMMSRTFRVPENEETTSLISIFIQMGRRSGSFDLGMASRIPPNSKGCFPIWT